MDIVFVVLYVLAVWIVLPAAIIWGWAQWWKTRQQTGNWISSFSWIGFALATLSGLLAVGSLVYGRVIGGFQFYDPQLLRIFRWGSLLSLSALVCGLVGVWRPGPLRWYAPACGLGTLLFWIAAMEGE